jgi:3D (Asp-Asp-Asp) domain-containing protein
MKHKTFKFTYKLAIFFVLGGLLLDLSSPRVVKAETVAIDSTFEPIEMVQGLPQAGDREPRKVISALVTVYTSTPDQTDDTPFITATGERVHDGLVAANFLPFGTRVRFPDLYGDKTFIVYDRMNARYGYGHVDIWLDTTKQEARKFGAKRLKMEIF